MKNSLFSRIHICNMNSLVKKATTMTVAMAVMLTSVPLSEFVPVFNKVVSEISTVAHADVTPRHGSVTYNDLTDFVAYSLEYSAHDAEYCEDEITLALNTGSINTFPSNYIPLGTAEHPFNGKIYITQTYGETWWFETDKPIFDYVTDSAVINYSDSAHNTEPIEIELRRKENSTISPLFANHVKEGGSTKATWKIKSAIQTQGVGDGTNYLPCNYSGLIGDIGDSENAQSASVTIEYDNSAVHGSIRCDVTSDSGDVGLICGTMYKGTTINLKLTGSNTGCYVTASASDSNAGGLVGKMCNGSTLDITETYVPVDSRQVNAPNGCAGGIVGYNDGGQILFTQAASNFKTQVRGTITGKDAAGGIFGYYTNYVNNSAAQAVTFDLRKFDINCTVNAPVAGGIAGKIDGKANITVDGSESGSNEITVNGDTVTQFGGVAGTYQTTALTNKFEINTVTANTSATFTETGYYGGAIGQIVGNSAAYIKVGGFTHKSSSGFDAATAFGGVVGHAGNKGSMLDVGSVTVETGSGDGEQFNGGGIVGVLSKGVLRLSGTTNLTKAPVNAAHDYGQLVGIRKDSLVYAVGNGNTGNWIFNRSKTDVEADDIGTWGSIVRISNIETDVLTFDSTAHTVTVKAPVTSDIATAADYTKTAINMQLNNGGLGALLFADSTNTKSSLLSQNISIKASTTIDLSGTGNIGLMRDDYKTDISEIGLYTKTLSGGTDSKIELAIGEHYGVYAIGDGDVCRGAITFHRYNGLLARTGGTSTTTGEGANAVTTYTRAEISGLAVDGTININSKQDGTTVGGFIGSVKDTVNITNCVSQVAINFKGLKDTPSNMTIGGLIGDVSAGTVSDRIINFTGSAIAPNITVSGSIGAGASGHSVGGGIGRISSASVTTINVSSTTISAVITQTGSCDNVSTAGLIADIASTGKKTMNLTGVTVNGTSITNAAAKTSGGFLGNYWPNTDVNFTESNGVIVSETAASGDIPATSNVLTTDAASVAGLVQMATGHWTVPNTGISITGMTITKNTTSLGILVHDGYSGTDGLYLELTHSSSYNLASELRIPDATTYDELVAATGSDILSNGSNGIISITTNNSGVLYMDGTNSNTYTNVYHTDQLNNNNSRYYYNLTGIYAKENKSDGENLLLWSLNIYAASNIKSYFPTTFTNTISGNFDMVNLSYYPIDIGKYKINGTGTEYSSVNIGNATFTFYNKNIEKSEGGTETGYASDATVRTTRGASQHYLMHSGLFRNVSSSVSTSGDIHFRGDIGVGSVTTGSGTSAVTTIYSGALINGTLSGTLTTSDSKEIVFEGMTISDSTKYLFINEMTTNSKLTLSGVRTGGGKNFSNVAQKSETAYTAGATVASSLIGDVSGNGIQIKFDRMKLDSRTSAVSPADWSEQYGTTKSIFSGATFLNKFDVDNNSTGTYEFLESEDWDNGTHNANVTYGLEIKTSKEYENKQQKYYDETNAKFVDPVNDPSSRTDVYPFDSGFLPYVNESTAILAGDPPVSQYLTRELKVNVRVAGLTEGCGTYNDPYKIRKGSQLTTVAKVINKTVYPDNLRLPMVNCNKDSNLTNLNNKIKNHWCGNNRGDCAVFTRSGSEGSYTYTYSSYTWTQEQVSLYLASAYYMVMDNIEIETSEKYPGLGSSPNGDKTGKYAFRGVIVGASADGSVKITNKSGKFQCSNSSGNLDKQYNTAGLITMSNGCVIKNLTIEVDLPDEDLYNYSPNSNQKYEYTEGFPNYGAVINKIMGGDNIIDNVTVQYDDTFYVHEKNDYKATVGGFVGCVVNGGLIFRNVDDDSLDSFVVKKVGTSNNARVVRNVTVNGHSINSLTDENDLIHIHVNPFVGRVINGYAIRETNSYGFSEDGATYGDGETRTGAVAVTMHNTRKNYSIPDIDTTKNYQNDVTNSTTNVLTFSQSTSGGTYDTITVPNSQALYIMSIIAQSGSGCATGENNNYAYNISYCGGDSRSYSSVKVSNAVVDNNKATHWANYDAIGADTQGDDYTLSKNDTINNKKAVPYIIHKYTSNYTSGTDTFYPARTLTKRTFYVNLVQGETYYLPDCFRGIGFLGSAEYVNDNMKIYGFNGNGATIDLNAEYFTHRKSEDPYYGGNSINMVCGMALFNSLQQWSSDTTNTPYKYETDSKYQITDFTLQGYISAHHVNPTDRKTNNVVTSYAGEDDNASPTGNLPDTHFCSAGFVSQVNNENIKLFNIFNVSFKAFHINSYSYAGGFIAYTNGSSVRMYINNCNADGFKIEGSGRIAGFVGSYDSTKSAEGGIHINTGLDANGKDTFTSAIRNTIVNNRFKTDNKCNYSAGIVGSVYATPNVSNADQGDHALGTLILRNVTIEGGNAETNYIGNKNDPSGSSGGIMGGGTKEVKGCLIQNCVVKDIDIYGRYSGGIMGENANRRSDSSLTGARIVGCKVTGTLDNSNNPQYTIMAQQYAGGIYGDTRDKGSTNAKYKSLSAGDTSLVEYKTDIDGVYVYGYNIYSMNTGNSNTGTSGSGFAAGGITGNNDENRYIQNCKVEKCVIDVGTNSTSASETPCAGLIGRIGSGKVQGYNIEVKDCDFQTHRWSAGAPINVQKAYSYTDENSVTHTPVSGMKCGNVIGNCNSKDVNIIAIDVENCPAETDFNSVSTSSFNVYADYNDVGSTANKGTEMSTLSTLPANYSNVSEGGLKDYFPNVNVSPVTKMGTNTVVENEGEENETTTVSDVILTGDGAALYSKAVTVTDENNQTTTTNVPTPTIDAIVNEPNSNYTKPTAEIKTFIQNALTSTAVEGQPNKISTYKTEMGTLPDGVDDFTVLVINSENRDYSTALIDNYIQMITNTSYEFMSKPKWSSKYNITVKPCTYDGEKYVIGATGKTAGLVVEAPNSDDGYYRYYMVNTYADSNQGNYQFSLMDVQFYNPNTNLKEVVYHLYVPVLTKKMLLFTFESASQLGTDNKAANFTNYANTLANSLESWYTGYLHFTYGQTELQSMLESGAGLNWNATKTILFKYQTNSVASKLGANTQLVLCDPNNDDKYYYSTLSSHRPQNDSEGETDTINFSAFNTQLNGEGTGFTPKSLNDLLLAQGFTITASVSNDPNENIYIETNNLSEADVIASNGTMYKSDESGQNGTHKLRLSYIGKDNEPDPSKVLEENYYLAVYAKGNSVYNYSIRTPATISGGENKPTLRRSNADEGSVTNIIMGSLYSQTVTIGVQNNGQTSPEITSTNHRLDVTLRSIIELDGTESDKDYMLNHLSNPNIHLYQSFVINLTAEDESGSRSEIRGTPNVTTDFSLTGNGSNYSQSDVPPGEFAGTYIQLQEYDVKSYLSKNIPAVIVATTQIDFDEAWKYNAEFPVQDGTQEKIGVNVSAVSNLSYNEEKLRFTNLTQLPQNPSTAYYYIKQAEEPSLVFNMKTEILDEYDKVGSPSFNYSQQGINPKNFIDTTQTRLPIKTAATYDATSIKRTDFGNAEKIQYVLKLYKKVDDGSAVKYTEVDNVANYIDLTKSDSVFIKVNNGVTSEFVNGAKMTKSGSNKLTYTADISQSAFSRQEDQIITADIDFTVITGQGFTEFANYRFVLEVELLKPKENNNSEYEPITNNSYRHDWVVYTNAKINPNILTNAEYSGN